MTRSRLWQTLLKNARVARGRSLNCDHHQNFLISLSSLDTDAKKSASHRISLDLDSITHTRTHLKGISSIEHSFASQIYILSVRWSVLAMRLTRGALRALETAPTGRRSPVSLDSRRRGDANSQEPSVISSNFEK